MLPSLRPQDGLQRQRKEVFFTKIPKSIRLPPTHPARTKPSYYQYEALADDTAAIRLLTILPASTDEMLSFSIERHHFSGYACPSYTALSYTWGDGPPQKPILLNGRPFKIRQNLWDLLFQLWRRQRDIDPLQNKFWADAICIDQNNPSERDAQVHIMRDIFTRAQHVLGWIGYPDAAFGMMLRYILNVSKVEDNVVCPTSGYLNMEVLMRKICNRPYWTRSWIAQEILLARRLSIRIGEFTLEWPEWLELVRQYDSCSYLTAPIVLERVRSELEQGTLKSSFNELLDLFDSTACSIARDKVFIMLNFLGRRDLFQGNYNDPPLIFFYKALDYCSRLRLSDRDGIRLGQQLCGALGLLQLTHADARKCEIKSLGLNVSGEFEIMPQSLEQYMLPWAQWIPEFNTCLCLCSTCKTNPCWKARLEQRWSWEYVRKCLVYKIPLSDRFIELIFEPLTDTCLSSATETATPTPTDQDHNHELIGAASWISASTDSYIFIWDWRGFECSFSHGRYSETQLNAIIRESRWDHTVKRVLRYGRRLLDRTVFPYTDDANSGKDDHHYSRDMRRVSRASFSPGVGGDCGDGGTRFEMISDCVVDLMGWEPFQTDDSVD
jgi:hypothetical protein